MTSASASTQQIPAYFLQEASELLQQIDSELQTLRQDFSVQKMHGLMRAAHTLKGAAASVGLDAIKTTTHSLEDAFKALCRPDATLTPVVEGLIFEAYDCLQLMLSAQLTHAQIDESGILDRMASVVTKLQDNLGDQFGQDGYLPTSSDLGFDMTQSIFEMGVAQRLDALEESLKTPKSETLNALLQSQAEVFFGLAESLNLPGFGEIAQATLAALKNQPDQVIQIATAALKDYRSAQTDILQGDRTQGGAPSAALKRLAAHTSKKTNQHRQSKSSNSRSTASKPSWLSRLWSRLNQPIGHAKSSKYPLPQPSPQPLQAYPKESLAASDSINKTEATQTLENLWENISPLPAEESNHVPSVQSEPVPPVPPARVASKQASEKPTTPAKDDVTLRISINHLEQFNHTIGELLTQQSRQALYNEHLTTTMKLLLLRLSEQQQQLHKLQRHAQTSVADHASSKRAEQSFDVLELDRYSEQQLLVQASLDTMVQQMESTEAMELFVRQSNQTLAKQQRLVNDLRETMLEARMQPLGDLLQRFHQVLTRLSMQYSKPVTLQIHGDEVLVDKAIVDQLYDPLLHLVRNAFDHGIETPEVRQQQSKPKKGQITISASQTGRHLTIKIQDDGQGLNLAAIRQKAIDNQLVTATEAQQLTPAQISNLIFESELSTAAQVSDLSGRGVGLDVVRSQMQTLGGQLAVTHQPGQGTCFILKIPANLTISQLLLCRAGERLYALMTDTIEQILMPKAGQLKIQNNRKVLSLHAEGKAQLSLVVSLSEALAYNELLPNLHSSENRAEKNNTSAIRPIILIRYKNRLVGLEIDQLVGEQELVIRSLGDLATTSDYIYGCCSLPDGHLSLVMDGAALVQKKLREFSQQSRLTPIKGQQAPRESASRSASKQSILIVDDSITVRNTLTKALENAGYWVLQAKEGNEALQKLQQTDVAAILCDLEMPGMNGFEFLKARQNTPKIASVPTIMLTSRTGVKHRQLAQELGATDYLTKPYLTPQLLTTLTNACKQHSQGLRG
ncbi:hybrid sensor histidine kinase/response regulator [Leptolyngbya cf. ectocarpi LEGE 11479]|uniref:histidine kinase n=1 Tax=Leptolyngbya cf. ectocarpi LEGE 11479 TaxID=1828722 RepID=A0A928ZSU6_LEPEC|nr:hybrid sensor histidine kinase/response regulator [Leptolyngbya ectocarpi]MBE9065816.1 hybrid sensor histidine kinase/response regulator [Leptolyngbya cf. ectocarpi LEGE 11479]